MSDGLASWLNPNFVQIRWPTRKYKRYVDSIQPHECLAVFERNGKFAVGTSTLGAFSSLSGAKHMFGVVQLVVELRNADSQTSPIPSSLLPLLPMLRNHQPRLLITRTMVILLVAHFTRAQVGVCQAQFGTVRLWVGCVVTLHLFKHTTSPHVAVWARHKA